MISQCSNPGCGRAISSLAEGRLYQFEITSISISAVDDHAGQFDEVPQKETAHFWLCSQCAASMTLSLEPLGGLKVVPLDSIPPGACNVTPISKPIHDC